MAEGKVGSLFIEFRTNVNQILADFEKMSSGVRTFGSTVSSVSKNVSDLGHLGSTAINNVLKDLGGLTSGITNLNTFVGGVREASGGIADMGHLGSQAINQVVADLGGLVSSINNVNTSVRNLRQGVVDLGHFGAAAIAQVNHDLGGLAAGLSTANAHITQRASGISDVGHLTESSAPVKQIVNDLGGLVSSGTGSVNTFTASVRQATGAVGDLGHLGTVALKEVTGDFVYGTTAVNTFAASVRQAGGDLGHLGGGTPIVKQVAGDLVYGTTAVNNFANGIKQASSGVADLGHLGGAASRSFVTGFTSGFNQISSEIRKFDRVFYPFQRLANDAGRALTLAVTVPVIGLGAYALKTGMEFETAFAGVRKTVEATEPQFAALREELIKMSTTAPVTAAEFADIAATAGQLGIAAPNIARFAQTIAELQAATKISGQEAANFLGRFTNITQLPADKIHNLASTLFALGKAFPAVETEIANFGLRIARVGSFVGLTDGQILAFATALASVGVSAEQGATAITRVFAEMDKAVLGGGAKLAEFAAVAAKSTALAGVSAEGFAKAFKTDSASAVAAFVEGLKNIRAEGGNVFTTLDALKLSNVRVRDTLLALAAGSNELTDALGIQASEFVKDSALKNAYNERNKTTASQLKILKDQVDALGISLFDTFAPALNQTVIPAMKRFVDEGLKPMVEWFSKTDEGTRNFITGVALTGAVIGPALLTITKFIEFFGGVGIILSKPLNIFGSFKTVFAEISTAARAAAGAEGIGAFITALKTPLTLPWWLEAAPYIALTYEVYRLAEGYRELVDAQEKSSQTQAGVANGVMENVNRLKKLGFDIDVRGKSIEDLKELTHNIIAAMGNAEQLGNALGNLKTKVPNLKILSPEELEEQRKAAEALAKEHQKLLDKFKDELKPANALNEELDFLLQNFITSDQIVAVYGKKIVDATEAQKNHGFAVTGTTARLYDQAKAVETLADRVKELQKNNIEPISTPLFEGPLQPINDIQVKALGDFNESIEQIKKLGEAIDNLSFLGTSAEVEIFSGQLDKAEKIEKAFGIALNPTIKALIAQKKYMEDNAKSTKEWEDATNFGIKTTDDMTQQISAASVAIERMDEAGFATSTILDVMGKVIDEAAENARILGIELDPVIAKLKQMRDEMNNDKKEATEFERTIERLTVKIVNDLANGIADAILSGKSLVRVAEQIAKDFAAAFIKAVVSELFAPLVNKFQELGRTIADQLTKLLKAAMSGAAGPIVAIVAGIAVAIAAVIKSTHNSHLFANQFVKEIENPFAKSFGQFIDAQNALFAAGRQTYQGAQEAETKVREMWDGFVEDAKKFGEEGRKQGRVANQAIANLLPTVGKVLDGIQAQIEALKPPSLRAFESVNALEAYRKAIAGNTAEHIAELQAQADAIKDQIYYVQLQITAQEELGNSTDDLQNQLKNLVFDLNDVYSAMNPVIPTLYSFAEAVNTVSQNLVPDKTLEFLDEVLNATSGAANLEEALGVLEAIGTPVAIILDRLGSDIEQFANALALSGLPVPPLIEKYLHLAQVSKNVGDGIPRIANSLSKLVGDAVEKLRQMANGGDLAQGILDALGRLLTGLPAPGSVATSSETAVKDAVDKLRGVTESILAELKKMTAPIGPSADVRSQSIGPNGYLDNNLVFPTPNAATMQVTINIVDNEVINNEFTFTENIGRREVRDHVIPEITEALTNNTDSTTDRWRRILRGAGVVAK